MGGWSWIVLSNLDDSVVQRPPVEAVDTTTLTAQQSAPVMPVASLTDDGLHANAAAHSAELEIPDPEGWTAPSATAGSAEPADPSSPPIARMRRNLAAVSGGLVKQIDPAAFTDLFATRIHLTNPHPLLALLLASFSSEDEQASILWRIAIDGEPGAGTLIGRTMAIKSSASRKSKTLTVYGVSRALDPGEHTVRIQVSSDRPTTVSIRPAASSGAESLRLIVFELL